MASAEMPPMRETLDRDTILRALGRLSKILGDRGITGEVCLLGGTVMVLAFNAEARRGRSARSVA